MCLCFSFVSLESIFLYKRWHNVGVRALYSIFWLLLLFASSSHADQKAQVFIYISIQSWFQVPFWLSFESVFHDPSSLILRRKQKNSEICLPLLNTDDKLAGWDLALKLPDSTGRSAAFCQKAFSASNEIIFCVLSFNLFIRYIIFLDIYDEGVCLFISF